MAKLKPEEISSILAKELEQYDRDLKVESLGTILQVGDGIARIHGLRDVMAGELVKFPGDIFGMVLNLEEDSVGVAIFGEDTHIKEGDQVTRTGEIASVPVGEAVVGRVLNAVGQPIDGEGPVPTTETRKIEVKAPGVIDRQPVKVPADDRHQGDRRHDAHRPRPARADHRRPPDRQDGHRHRHHHQPEGQGRVLLLRGHRPEAVHRRRRVPHAEAARRDGVHHHHRRLRQRARPHALHRALHRLHHGRALHVAGQGHAGRLRRPLQAGQRLPPALAAAAPARRAARRTPATCSTCTAVCSSAP